MNYVVTYSLKWEVVGFENYKFTTCKKLFNVKTGNEIKKTIKGTTAGYYINRKFIKRAVKPIHRFLAWIGCKAQS